MSQTSISTASDFRIFIAPDMVQIAEDGVIPRGGVPIDTGDNDGKVRFIQMFIVEDSQ